MNPEHPKAIAAREAAERRNEVLAYKLEQINRAKRDHRVRFVRAGRHTICYRVDLGRVIELSTTIRNPRDQDNKIVGQYEALLRFNNNNNNNRIHMRVPNGWMIGKYLQIVFNFD